MTNPSWQEILELHRAEYLAQARDIARELLETRPSITVNDIRERLEPPATVDPRVMGAVLRHRDFEPTGEFVLSSRKACHARPIQRFRLTDWASVGLDQSRKL